MADTGFIFPGTAADGGGGDHSLDGSVNNIKTDDSNHSDFDCFDAFSTHTSNWYRATNFDFSAIGDGDTIDGIEVVIKHVLNLGGTSYSDADVQLRTTAGRTGNDKGVQPPSSLTTTTYGGATDTWGTSYGATDIKGSDFGVDFNITGSIPGGGVVQYEVYYVKMKIYYTAVASGYGNDVLGVPSANISKVHSVETANISKVYGS